MKLYTCHIIDNNIHLRDGNTIRVCLIDNRDNADIWICPVDSYSYAEIKVEIVKSYDSPQYTAYLCSQTEYQNKKDDINRAKDDLWRSQQAPLGSGLVNWFSNLAEEGKRLRGQREQYDYKDYLPTGTALEELRKSRPAREKKEYEELDRKKPKYILSNIIPIIIILIGIWLISCAKNRVLSDQIFLWILAICCFIGAFIIFCVIISKYNSFKKRYKELEKKYGGHFKGTSREEITHYEIPKGTKVIQFKEFSNCYKLRTVIIPEGVTRILPYAFDNCMNLTIIILPKSLKEIGDGAFMGCHRLVEIYNYSAINIPLVGKHESNPDKILAKFGHINQHALVIHTKQEPSILFTYNDFVFININGSYSLLQYNGNETKLVLPNEVNGRKYNIYEGAFNNNFFDNNISEIVIPAGVEEIGRNAFRYCKSLEKVIILEGTKHIERWAFEDCKKLEHISIPDSVTTIEEDVFSGSYKCRNKYNSGSYVGSEKNPYLCLISVEINVKKLLVHPKTKYIILEDIFDVNEIHLPIGVKFMSADGFYHYDNHNPVIYYEGTKEDFQKIHIERIFKDRSKLKVYLKDDSITYF